MEQVGVPGGVRLSDEASVLTLTRPRRHIELLRAEGRIRLAAVDAILAHRMTIIEECGRISIFDDLSDTVGYDSSVRARLTQWAAENRSKISTFQVLTGSRLVAMGVAVSNVALGGNIKVHLKREGFEESLRQAIEGD